MELRRNLTKSENIHATPLYIYMMLKSTATKKGVAIYFVILPSITHTDQAVNIHFQRNVFN
jgi:hypothetical protein